MRLIHVRVCDGEDLTKVPIDEVFRRYPNFLILGDPGSGKTTLLA